MPKPRAILMVSAHWYVNATAVTAMPHPRTIHDFFGFPEQLFAVQYPAPGSAAFAEEVAEIAKPTQVGSTATGVSMHGTWSLLVHAFPKVDSVVQLSLDARKSFEHHLELGARLAGLRRSGVLIVGSGNVVHNLRAMILTKPELGFDWAYRFNDASREFLVEKPAEVAGLLEHPDYAKAAPTPYYFIPAPVSGRPGRAPRTVPRKRWWMARSSDSFRWRATRSTRV